ncbi:MAG: DMT family transporter [Ignavibacterium sp.]|jgi:drug/metabolite transporter (DMT)-like permease|nr:DMT family transporter [Ignavibacterium sp.]
MSYIGELSAVLTAFLWSGTSLAFSSATEKIGSLQVNISRLLLASAFLIVTIFLMGYNFNLSESQFVNLIISGVIGLVVGDSFLFKSYQLVGARISMLLMSLSPGMSAILAFVLLEERITPVGVSGIFITIAGIMLVVLERNNGSKYKNSRLGIIYGFIAALGQATGLIFAKYAFDEGYLAAFVATFVRIFSSVLIILPLAFLFKRFSNPLTMFTKNKSVFGSIFLGTILGPYLGITFSLISIEYTKVGIAATLMATPPIIMLPMVRYLYKEKLSWRAIIGALIAVVGVGLMFLS